MSASSLPDGVTLRQVVLEGDGDAADSADVDIAYAVADACERAVHGTPETSREELRSLLAGPQSPRDGQLLAYAGPRAVGLLSVEVDPTRREVFADVYAVPDGPEGLLDALVAQGVEYARTVSARDRAPRAIADVEDPWAPTPDVWQLRAGSFDADTQYRKALERNGLRPVRRHWQMHVDLVAAGIGPDDPAPPAGASRVVARSDEQIRDLHAAYADSFRDHYGAGPLPLQEWLSVVRALPGADPDRWWLALLDAEPVGLCLLDDSRVEFGDSYVRTLGVARTARGRGIARWLLGCAFADAVRRGLTGVALTVDSDSPTGATRLYEGMGMSPRRVIDAWCLPV